MGEAKDDAAYRPEYSAYASSVSTNAEDLTLKRQVFSVSVSPIMTGRGDTVFEKNALAVGLAYAHDAL